jgi:hypothetical protein
VSWSTVRSMRMALTDSVIAQPAVTSKRAAPYDVTPDRHLVVH